MGHEENIFIFIFLRIKLANTRSFGCMRIEKIFIYISIKMQPGSAHKMIIWYDSAYLGEYFYNFVHCFILTFP